MKFNRIAPEFDTTDRAILELLQEDCKQPLSEIGQKVGLKAPAVLERIHKFEEAGVVVGYVALLDGRRLGKDVTAFIGVSTDHAAAIAGLEGQVAAIADVLECHHVTGAHTLMVKVKTVNTQTLEELIETIRSLDGVARTETMVVLSTHIERSRVSLHDSGEFETRQTRQARRNSGQRRRRSGA